MSKAISGYHNRKLRNLIIFISGAAFETVVLISECIMIATVNGIPKGVYTAIYVLASVIPFCTLAILAIVFFNLSRIKRYDTVKMNRGQVVLYISFILSTYLDQIFFIMTA